MKQYVTAKGSNAGLGPYFDASGVSAKGDYAVVFRLKSPVGVFPYLLSQTTYQAPIQPASIAANPGTWVATGMIGTGAFKVKKYVTKVSAELVRHAAYWGGHPPLDGVKIHRACVAELESSAQGRAVVGAVIGLCHALDLPVLEAAVVPEADPEGLLRPKAFVVLKADAKTDGLHEALKEHVKQKIGPWKYPRWIDVVEALPKTATGKIQRFKLRDGAG